MKIMETNTSNYQREEANKNKAEIKSDLLSSSIKEVPVQMIQKNEIDAPIPEEEIKEAADELFPDKNSMESRG